MRTLVAFDPRCHFDVGNRRDDPVQRGLVIQIAKSLIDQLGRMAGKPIGCRKIADGPPERYEWHDGNWTVGYTLHEEFRLVLGIPPAERVVIVKVRMVRLD